MLRQQVLDAVNDDQAVITDNTVWWCSLASLKMLRLALVLK